MTAWPNTTPTTSLSLISDNNETAYRKEVRDLAVWCQDNNLYFNMSKRKELIVDYRKRWTEQAPININRAVVELVESFKFLGVHITNKLSWSKHTKTLMKRAQHHIFPLRRLKRFDMGPQILKVLQLRYREHPDRLHQPPGMATALHLDRKALQREVRAAQYITGAKLPAIQDLYNR